VNDAPVRGADAFVAALQACGAELVFGNPGSTELAFLDAVARSGMEYVTCLHEAVAVGAAEGYARVGRRAGVVQLHTVAGVGNASGMLANALVGRTPIVAYAGSPARVDAWAEPVLGGDVAAAAAPVAKWVWELRSAAEIPAVVARAFKVALTPPFGPVVLVGATDVMSAPCDTPVVGPSLVTRARPDAGAITEAAEILGSARSPAILIGDGAAAAQAGSAVAKVAALLAAPVYSAATEAVVEGAPGLPIFDTGRTAEVLSEHDAILAVGTPFLRLFAPSAQALLAPGTRVVHVGSDPWELAKNHPALAIFADERLAMVELAEQLTGRIVVPAPVREAPGPAGPALDADAALEELAAALPADSIIIDESVSAIPAVERRLRLRPGAWFRSRGGALGPGMAMPIGAALAAPARTVVAIVGDGSAMYTPQALWTAANRGLRIVVVVLDNGGYGILDQAGKTAGLTPAGTRLDEPAIDFCGLARALGVAAHRATTRAEAAAAFRAALAEPPSLVHLVLDRTEAPL
jgi:benzoylformate decarboxylase